MLDSKISFYVITGNVCTHCSLYCVSTKQAQRLQTGLRLRDRNATMTSKWKGSYDSGRKYRSEWKMTFVWVQKVPIDLYANCLHYLRRVCNFTNHEKSRKISAPVQCQARFNLNFEEKNFWYACNLRVFCDKGMAIPHIKFGFFLAFKQLVWPFSGLFLALFGFLLKFPSGNPGKPVFFNPFTAAEPSANVCVAHGCLCNGPSVCIGTNI